MSVNVYKLFADSKDFGFKDQITRSSLSVASNIAEGLEKDSDKEKGRFIEITKGSAAELITQVYIEIGYIQKRSVRFWMQSSYCYYLTPQNLILP